MDPPALAFSASYDSKTVNNTSLNSKIDRYACIEASGKFLDSDSSLADYRNDVTEDDRKVFESARDCIIKYREQVTIDEKQRKSHFIVDEEVRLQKDNAMNDKAQDDFNEGNSWEKIDKESEKFKSEARENNQKAVYDPTASTLSIPEMPTRDPQEVDIEAVPSGFFIGLVEFLASVTVTPLSTALGSLCSSSQVDDELSKKKYDLPLMSVKDNDDVDAWDIQRQKRRKTNQISGFAKAIRFSSNRIDGENAAIALYDKDKLKQEEYKVNLPGQYFDVIEVEDEEASIALDDVPAAVIVKPNKTDDISVLEDHSVYAFKKPVPGDQTTIKAWSLSPRRQRLLRTHAKAIATKMVDVS